MTLPRIDEHAVEIDAPPDEVWSAIERGLPRMNAGRGSRAFARALGCRHLETTARSPLEVGATIPGFRVSDTEPPHLIGLEGEHRFSSYRLDFHVDELPDGTSRVRAETHAAFPGLRGSLYRTLVIGSRGHVVAVRRLLRTIKRRAEEGTRR
jgi:hypothetical protein